MKNRIDMEKLVQDIKKLEIAPIIKFEDRKRDKELGWAWVWTKTGEKLTKTELVLLNGDNKTKRLTELYSLKAHLRKRLHMRCISGSTAYVLGVTGYHHWPHWPSYEKQVLKWDADHQCSFIADVWAEYLYDEEKIAA